MSAVPLHFRAEIRGGVKCLVPLDDAAEAYMARRKPGATVALESLQIRNAKFSAIYWIYCRLVAENHEELASADSVDSVLRAMAGHWEVICFTLPDGTKEFHRQAKSLSFASMNEDAFQDYVTRCEHIIAQYLLPGVDIEEMRKEAYVRAGEDAPKVRA